MKTIDLARCPTPDPVWLSRFMREFLKREPALSAVVALDHALVAHRVIWLLPPDEAAELWLQALHHQGWIASP